MFTDLLSDFSLWRIVIIILDIGLITFIFYHILLLFNRTRALQFLIGIIIWIFVDVFARFLNLSTLSWIIENISSYLVIAAIILMQPELRRLIMSMGNKNIFRLLHRPAAVPLDQIVVAVQKMSAKRIGSIIVILCNFRPTTIIERAVALDAKCSPELLETIFWKESPLHDGAVIMEGAKLVAASCYLPLSNSPKLKKTSGARHRAAMGISEEIDAVIIVTSEENGQISVMHNANIFYPKLKSLESLISSLIISQSKSSKKKPLTFFKKDKENSKQQKNKNK